MASQIRSCMEYLIPTLNILLLSRAFTSHTKNLVSLAIDRLFGSASVFGRGSAEPKGFISARQGITLVSSNLYNK